MSFVPPNPLKTPVLFLVFNRPDTTAQVFEAIRKAKPPRLYIAADGPRPEKTGEIEKVNRVREITTAVDWPCEVKTLFRDENLGCKYAVSGGITWFFENEEEGIILEDDCLPSQSFFWFCEQLLEYFRNREDIFIISGFNKKNRWKDKSKDYFFSNFGGIWGWATWRRAWVYYNEDMGILDDLIKKQYFTSLFGFALGKIREQELLVAKRKTMSEDMDTWGYPWALSRHIQGGLACVSSLNLINNIGFGEDATHTKGENTWSLELHEHKFPLRNNDNIKADRKYDLIFLNYPNKIIFYKQELKKILKKIIYAKKI